MNAAQLERFRKEFDVKVTDNIALRDHIFQSKDDLSVLIKNFRKLTSKYLVIINTGILNQETFNAAVRTHFITQYFLVFLYLFDRTIHVSNGKLHHKYQKILVDKTMICKTKMGDFTDPYNTNSPIQLSLASFEGFIYDRQEVLKEIKAEVKVSYTKRIYVTYLTLVSSLRLKVTRSDQRRVNLCHHWNYVHKSFTAV